MFVTNKLRETLIKYPYAETIIIIAIYLLIGYMLNPNDICILNSKISFITIIMAMITLFHGLSSGLLAIIMLGVSMKFGYTDFPYSIYLREFVLVLIFGEFHYYWNRTISKYKIEAEASSKKLGELGKSFYMLKISHDQLEKSYVTKPMSLRNAIGEIKESLQAEEKKGGYGKFLTLIKKSVNIESAYLVGINKKEEMNVLYHTADKAFDSSDLMVEKALEKRMPIYVSHDAENYGSQYLAVIPAIISNEVVGLLVIERMPFLAFNKDNLITVSILINYFFEEISKVSILKEMGDFCLTLDENFRLEAYRQYMISKNHGIDSTVLIFKSYDKLETHLLYDNVVEQLRALEIYSFIQGEKYDVIVILFPFIDKSGVKGFLKRIDNLNKENSSIEYSKFFISDIALVESYIKDTK